MELSLLRGLSILSWPAAGVSTFAALTDVAIVRKTADETVNNSTTLQDDDELLLPIKANEVWLVEIFLLVVATAAEDFKFRFTGPAGATFSWRFVGKDSGASVVDLNYATIGSSANVWGQGNTPRVQAKGIVICSSTPGNLQLQWAQNTAIVIDTKVLANSIIIAHQLA